MDRVEAAAVVPRDSPQNDINEFVAVQNPKSQIHSRLWALCKDNYQPGLLRKVQKTKKQKNQTKQSKIQL